MLLENDAAACLGVLLDEEVKTKIDANLKIVNYIPLNPGELLLFSLVMMELY